MHYSSIHEDRPLHKPVEQAGSVSFAPKGFHDEQKKRFNVCRPYCAPKSGGGVRRLRISAAAYSEAGGCARGGVRSRPARDDRLSRRRRAPLPAARRRGAEHGARRRCGPRRPAAQRFPLQTGRWNNTSKAPSFFKPGIASAPAKRKLTASTGKNRFPRRSFPGTRPGAAAVISPCIPSDCRRRRW